MLIIIVSLIVNLIKVVRITINLIKIVQIIVRKTVQIKKMLFNKQFHKNISPQN